ncbi:DUF4239 domain-containing protein [Candidatus Bealeia paramacronuclearis]|uniref:bestrophin-like domain n=1 Tax=Candidatus Bealeia paramacronuclearis TaxID=1921001 RepID=UPI0030D36589
MFSIVSLFAVKSFIPLKLRYAENEAVGHISATIAVIYAVLFGFIAINLLDNFNTAEKSTQKESSVLEDIYTDSKLLPKSIHNSIRMDVEAYIIEVMEKEWPALEKGQDVSSWGDAVLNRMVHTVHNYTTNNSMDLFTQQEILKEIKLLFDAREERIFMGKSALSTDFWIVILIGAFLTIAVHFLFGMQFHLHLFSVVGVAFAISSVVFLIVAMDRPFRGEYCVKPEGFEFLRELIKNDVQKETSPP